MTMISRSLDMPDFPENYSPNYKTGTRRLRFAMLMAESWTRQTETLEWFFRNGLAGTVNGIYRYGDSPTQSLSASATGYTITISPGGAIVGGFLVRSEETTQRTINLLTTNELRWDGLYIDSDGVIQVAENVPLVQQDPLMDGQHLYRIVHRVGETQITNTDNGVDGYLVDMRNWVN